MKRSEHTHWVLRNVVVVQSCNADMIYGLFVFLHLGKPSVVA